MKIKILRTFSEKFSLGMASSDLDDNELNFTLNFSVDKDGSHIFFIGFEVKLKINDKLMLDVNYMAEFESDELVTPDILSNHPFMQVNAPAIAYPFLRAFVATVIVNAGHEPPMLPAVNFQELYTRRSKEAQQ